MFPCRLTCVAIVSLLLLTLPAARGETAEKDDSRRLGLHENFEIRVLPNVAWEFKQKTTTRSGRTSTPGLSSPHTLYFGAGNGVAYAFDPRSGAEKWTSNLLVGLPGPPAGGGNARFQEQQARPSGIATDGKILLQSVFDQSHLIAIDCATGDTLWTFQMKGWTCVPATDGVRIFVSSRPDWATRASRDYSRSVRRILERHLEPTESRRRDRRVR